MFLVSISSLLLLIHCEDKDKQIDKFERAPYVVFEKKPPKIVGVKAIKDLVYEVTIKANHVKTYRLDLKAELSGEPTDTVTLGTFDTFPLHLKYTAEDFANALKKKVEDISFGDHFDFIGFATGDNGTVYYPQKPSYERIARIKGDDSKKPVIPKGAMVTQTSKGDSTIIKILQKKGMLEKHIYDKNNGYNQAYSFGFIIGCPTDSQYKEAIVGTYYFISPFSGEITTAEIVQGPKENQFTIKSFLEKDKDLIFSVADQTEATVKNQLAINFKGMLLYAKGQGLTFSCLDTIQLTMYLCLLNGGCINYGKPIDFIFKKKE